MRRVVVRLALGDAGNQLGDHRHYEVAQDLSTVEAQAEKPLRRLPDLGRVIVGNLVRYRLVERDPLRARFLIVFQQFGK